MKKFIVSLMLLILLIMLVFVKPVTVAAQADWEKFNLWANNLGRRPGDPNYLTLHYRIRTFYFSIAPHPAHSIIFLGDSITYGGDWSRLFPGLPVENRGVGGDTTTGLLNRLNQIILLKPSQVFLMIGTNDLCYDRPIPEIIANYRRILEAFHTQLPNTQVYVQTVLPFNDTKFPSRGLRNNNQIRKLNRELRHVAAEFNDPYIDVATALTGTDGRLPLQYTSDGLHLNEAGYYIWRDQLQKLSALSPAVKRM